MDVSHAALGATFAALAAPSHQRRLAVLIGAAAALLPDADALIQSDTDPLLVLDYHRHFSHSLLFIPVGALIVTLLLWPWLRKQLSLGRVYAFSLAGIASSGLLDACTSYGTTDEFGYNIVENGVHIHDLTNFHNLDDYLYYVVVIYWNYG